MKKTKEVEKLQFVERMRYKKTYKNNQQGRWFYNKTVLYYLRVADLMGITFPYPRENIIAGNYILSDTQAFLSKCHRQQNKEILIRHSPGIGECFLLSNIQLTEKIKKISSGGCKNASQRFVLMKGYLDGKNKKLSSRACIYALHLLNICKDIFEPASSRAAARLGA